MKVKPARKPGAVDVEIGQQEDRLLAAAQPGVFHLKTILVPIDFSEPSHKALRYAMPFAAQFGARIILLHVVEPFVLPTDLAYVPVEMQETHAAVQANAQQKLEQLQSQLLAPPLQSELLVRVGAPWQEINEVASAREVDLIILSTHGYTGLKHVLLGSVAERIMRHAPCPVLVVREREHDFV